MTEFKTDNFIFFRFNPTNDNEMEAVNTLLNDRYVQKYLGNVDIRDFLLASRDDDEISDSSFLVGFNDEIVGYLSTFSGLDAIDLDYAVLPQFRGKKVNERIASNDDLVGILQTLTKAQKDEMVMHMLAICYARSDKTVKGILQVIDGLKDDRKQRRKYDVSDMP